MRRSLGRGLDRTLPGMGLGIQGHSKLFPACVSPVVSKLYSFSRPIKLTSRSHPPGPSQSRSHQEDSSRLASLSSTLQSLGETQILQRLRGRRLETVHAEVPRRVRQLEYIVSRFLQTD
jgi:hypothetical protein